METLELDITGVAHGGVFVARHEGRVVFVRDAIPGERVRVRLEETGDAATRRYWRGDVVEVVDASPDRRPHVWRAADVDIPPDDRPGGADFGHIRLDRQRALKREVIADALARIGHVDADVTIEPAHALDGTGETADGTGWRTRVSLHVDEDGRIGPYAARSHRIVPVDELPLATEAISAAAGALTDAAPGRVDLVQPADGRVRVLRRPQGVRRARDARRGRRSGYASHATDPALREVIVERAAGRDFRVDAGGFWQVHRLAAHTLTGVVAAALGDVGVDPDGTHLDLYGGVGLFAASIASAGGATTRVVSVESDPRATEHAGENLAEWVGARAETARVDRWLAGLTAEASAAARERLTRGIVVLDPPRSGAGAAVARDIASLHPTAVVYVACDPVALARDLGVFAEHGYRTHAVRGIDLYPNSHHVEAIAVLHPDGA